MQITIKHIHFERVPCEYTFSIDFAFFGLVSVSLISFYEFLEPFRYFSSYDSYASKYYRINKLQCLATIVSTGRKNVREIEILSLFSFILFDSYFKFLCQSSNVY